MHWPTLLLWPKCSPMHMRAWLSRSLGWSENLLVKNCKFFLAIFFSFWHFRSIKGIFLSLILATSIDVTHMTSRFYKWPPFNVWGAVAHTYLFFFSGPGVKGIAKTTNPSIAQGRRRAELHGAMFFVSLRHREVELLPKGNFGSHILAVSCHRALLKRRYLDSTTSNLEN